MEVEFLKEFSRDLDKLTSASTKRQVSKLIDRLSSLDTLTGVSNLKKLKGHKKIHDENFYFTFRELFVNL